MSATQGHIKIKLREINRHLVCRLCRGYYVDATTIAECLHSFCRSCIIKYLEKNSFCPICEVQIHKTKPYLSLRLDKALQDVVYKVVPGLYHDEMKRRRAFYTKRQEQIPFATPEQCGLEERIIFSPEDSISLSLEYLESDDYENETVSSRSSESGDIPDVISFPQQLGLMKLKNNNEGKVSRRESQDIQETSSFPKRYLQCPAVVNIGHLKKFLRLKHDLSDKMQVNIIHKRVPLPDYYTLMDVAYIYTWKRSAPLRFFYQVHRTKKQKLPILSVVSETKKLKMETIPEDEKPLTNMEDEKKLNNSVVNPSVENDESAKSSVDRNNSSPDELKQTEVNNALKNVDTNKSETAVVKTEVTVKVESCVNSTKEEKKEGFESDLDKCATPRSGKSEKLTSASPNAIENKIKSENPKRKTEKVQNNAKENDSNSERLLLNPISGKLESVPSNEPIKSNVNGMISAEGIQESSDCFKRDITPKEQKKTDTQNAKDSKKSNVNLLKSFRKEKLSTGKEEKLEVKSRGSSLMITAVPKNEKPPEKEKANFSVEIKADNKESEYDFDGSSPPSKIIPLQEFSKYSKYSKYMADHRDKWLSKESKNNWMSLKDFREKMLKENNSNESDLFKKNKKKVVPSLYKINSDKNKTTIKKTPNGKLANDKWKGSKIPRTVINIQTGTDDKKTELKVEVLREKKEPLLKPIKIENKNNSKEGSDKSVKKCENGEKNYDIKKEANDEKQTIGLVKESAKDTVEEKKGNESTKEKMEAGKKELVGVIDLSKGDSSQKSENPSESLMDVGSKTSPKSDDKVMEALISAAQKQSIEPLLKIPQYSQTAKNSQVSPVKNISPSEISQALQFLEDLRSDIKVLEAKNQINPNSVLEQFTQKSGNFQPYQELYQQKIDLIKRWKRHQQTIPNDSESVPRKMMKLSPTSETKKKLSPTSEQKAKISDEASQYKSSLDKTLSQIQLLELENRMLAAQNYKNLPALLQYYSRAPNFCSGPTSPSKCSQQKTKAPSHSPNSSKSPQGRPSLSGNPSLSGANPDTLFNAPSYLINAGLNSEMTYLQMFQSYLSQQEQMNQVKLSQMAKKPVKFNEVSPKSLTDKYFVPQTTAKKQESNNSVATSQKT